MTKSKQIDVYVILTGVSGNLGDAVIRRRVLKWCRGLGRIHAYIGKTTPGWLDQLALTADEKAYPARDRRQWLKGLLSGGSKKVLVFDPGEVPLGREHLKSEIMFLAIVLAVRLRGGIVFRPPRAVGEVDRLVGLLYRISSKLSNVVLWRERSSLSQMRVGRLVPDTAFAEPREEGMPWPERREIVVSMRGKRAFPSDEWFAGITRYAVDNGMRIVALSQVDEDEVRTKQIADRFGDLAEYVAWGTRGDLDHERLVRQRYLSSAIAISDRLHVLILAAQAGAMPVEIAHSPKPKVEQHFATIGMTGLSLRSDGKSADEITAFLASQHARRADLSTKMAAAATALADEIASFRSTVSSGRTG
ncbi:polysaccharide pyruvyl transferase family protein [Marisediminicola sp. LYQ134]|uniref:polysaccharide pyruvyl transferase family protein n=1 Tax=Marisediminicola sp. LYQ134 TaxID=3391061 RepID=UPI003983B556